jgi:hypothetical protein
MPAIGAVAPLAATLCWRSPFQAARRRTIQMVRAIRIRESASSQPPSIHWNGQNRLAG